MIDFFGRQLNAYKANLHTHSTNSDGEFSPAKVIEMYKNHGYDVLALTDHRYVSRISGLDSMGMTLIQSLEMHPTRKLRPDEKWHLVALNVSDDFVYDGTMETQAMIDYAVSDGAVVICAHPYWCGIAWDEVAELKNISGIEVYNTSTRYIGRQFNTQIWDELSDRGFVYPATAVDDMHESRDLFRGWTMIAAEDMSPASIVSALKQGDYYATMGPEFSRISFKDGVFEASFSPCTEAIIVTSAPHGCCFETEDLYGYGTGTRTLTECRLEIPWKFEKDNWFRLQIKDAQGRYAWTAPIKIPASK